jgi:hypothetical protein
MGLWPGKGHGVKSSGRTGRARRWRVFREAYWGAVGGDFCQPGHAGLVGPVIPGYRHERVAPYQGQPKDRAALVEAMLATIASYRIGDRSGRWEPQARKRRLKGGPA